MCGAATELPERFWYEPHRSVVEMFVPGVTRSGNGRVRPAQVDGPRLLLE